MNIRQEKKYTFSLSDLSEVRSKILSSKFLMTQAFNNRYVNSIYLDSLNFDLWIADTCAGVAPIVDSVELSLIKASNSFTCFMLSWL